MNNNKSLMGIFKQMECSLCILIVARKWYTFLWLWFFFIQINNRYCRITKYGNIHFHKFVLSWYKLVYILSQETKNSFYKHLSRVYWKYNLYFLLCYIRSNFSFQHRRYDSRDTFLRKEKDIFWLKLAVQRLYRDLL